MFKKIKVLLILISFICLLPNSLFPSDAFFEKGDTIYRKGFLIILGHAGLYKEWEGEDPDNYKEHKIIEIKKPEYYVMIENEFEQFYNLGFWSVRTNDLTYQQRRKIITIAAEQKNKQYSFFLGYKGPDTFRCDGLVEYCYEKIGIDIVPNDTWLTLSPYRQMKRQSLRTSAQLEKIAFHEQGIINEGEAITPSTHTEGEYNVEENTGITIKFYASDGDKGSGLTRAELWIEKPDGSTEDIGRDNTLYDVDHIYTFSYDTSSLETGEEYTLYALAYDQAGNSKEITLPFTMGIPGNKWEGYDLRLTFERDPEGPVYAISYREYLEDDWIELGEYDTKDTGGSGDIILNLGLDLEEFESEDDDADRITHQYKLVKVTTGKDVFKEAYGYKTIRLIVDTTADWNAGSKDGITVVDEVHPTGQREQGFIKPYFGTWTREGISIQKRGYEGSREEVSPGCYCFNLSHANLAWEDWYDGGSSIGGGVMQFWQRKTTIHDEYCYMHAGYENKVSFPLETKKLKGYCESSYKEYKEGGAPPPSATIDGIAMSTGEVHYFSVSDGSWSFSFTPSELEECHWEDAKYTCDYPKRWRWCSGVSVDLLRLDEDNGIWSRIFSSITSEKYEEPEIPTDGTQGKDGITGEWVVDEGTGEERWKVAIGFPYEEEVTTWFDRFRYDFKERKTEENPA